MDNYKIKVKDEAENKEAQELFFELGYGWNNSSLGGKSGIKYTDEPALYATATSLSFCGDMDHFHKFNAKDLTLPQLRDLVVLKRNDSRDANVNQGGEIPCLYDLYLTADKELYFYHCGKGKWLLSNLNHDEDYYATLKPIEKSEPQDPALISGAEALADITKVQHAYDCSDDWYTTQYSTLTIPEILKGKTNCGHEIKFRLKPQTIKVELELPKPFEPKLGEEVFYINDTNKHGYCVDEHQAHYNYNFGVWRTEDEIKQVVEQLRKIRGTNS
ncbi:hypothetical protein Q5X61_10775 [Acinetobacter baumannii]|nr:hypothetical protein [Acinetobacter baumannii]